MFTPVKSYARFRAVHSRLRFYSRGGSVDPRPEETAKRLTPWKYAKDHKKQSYGIFERFVGNTTDVIKFLSTPLDLRSSKLKSWVEKSMYKQELKLQAEDLSRLTSTGSDISAGHMLLDIGASVLFKGKPWMKIARGKFQQLLPPDEYEQGWVLEAVDISECPIHYEGFSHFRNLFNLHTLTAKKCPHLDDWCLDLIGSELMSLEVLDLSGCEKITPRGLAGLTYLPNLHTLELSDCPAFKTNEGILMCILLQDYNKKLDIIGVEYPAIPENDQPSVKVSSSQSAV